MSSRVVSSADRTNAATLFYLNTQRGFAGLNQCSTRVQQISILRFELFTLWEYKYETFLILQNCTTLEETICELPITFHIDRSE